ncbi:Ig domain protein [Leptospira ellisii]|nr:Ig domain protein [Leptospira ellisii]MDV6234433.1 Ig domain protein [Leptospira ellisii]
MIARSAGVTYNNGASLVFTKNAPGSYAPSVFNETVMASFTIQPGLTNSLSMDIHSGIISGTPTQSSGKLPYTVNFNQGRAYARLNIQVEETAGSGACNETGVHIGCTDSQPFSCTDRQTVCFKTLLACRRDTNCY